MSDSSTSATPPPSRMSAATASSRSRRRAASATAAPCPASATAVAAPIPLEAPVTNATVPFSSGSIGTSPSPVRRGWSGLAGDQEDTPGGAHLAALEPGAQGFLDRRDRPLPGWLVRILEHHV